MVEGPSFFLALPSTPTTNVSLLHARKCPGRYLAEGTLWITISYLLSTMDIKPPESEGARKLDDLEYLEGLI